MYNPYDFTEKKILVTGASSGIGRAVSIALSKQGATVAMIARNEERLDETLSQMEGSGHLKICVDLAETEDLGNVFKEAVSDGQKLNGLVHCAGIAQIETIKMLNRKRLDAYMRTNYYSFLELVSQYSKKKFNDGGSIVGISSIASVNPSKCQTIYAATKASMNISAEALSMELAPKNIRINTVMPGFVKTPMFDSGFESDAFGSTDYLENDLKQQLLGVTSPDEIANVCMFLLSEASSCITGRTLYADSGYKLG